MLHLSRSQDIVTGDNKYKEEIVLDSTEGEADAVRAINGASIIAFSPPISWNDFTKTLTPNQYMVFIIHMVYMAPVLTTHVCNVPHQLPPCTLCCSVRQALLATVSTRAMQPSQAI